MAELLAADRLGLIPDPRVDAAAIRATLCNLLGSGNRKFTAADFLPNFDPPRSRKQTPAEQRAILAAFAAGFNNRSQPRAPG